MSKGRIGSLVATVLFGVLAAVAVANVQYIQDAASYYQYEPSQEIVSLAEDAGMNDRGKFLFYASHPSIEEATVFNKHCSKTEKTTAILGCYDGRKIYIYNVVEPRLIGIEPTTAAHEMLHVAYNRLSSKDRTEVDALLASEYEKLKEDPELVGRMAFYDRTQPGEHNNELHSIIATEVESISPELEQYYTRYFTSRAKVIAQRNQYISVFNELRERASTLSSQIEELSQAIQVDQQRYNGEAEKLQASIVSFNGRVSRGEFEDRESFERERRPLIAWSNELEALRDKIRNAITEYNNLVGEFNAIATETEDLNRSIDSNLAPAPSL